MKRGKLYLFLNINNWVSMHGTENLR